MDAKIYVITHRKCDIEENSLYKLLQVGCSINGRILGMFWDDAGDNISAMNPFYSELTGAYYLWKNREYSKYVGLCHYRRFFLNKKGERLTLQDIESFLENSDIIVAEKETSSLSTEEVYKRCHYINDLYTVGKIIEEKYPEYHDSFTEVLSENGNHPANMMITSSERFDDYFSWLFPVLFEAEKRIDTGSYDNYHKRVYGFLAEILMNVWIKKQKLITTECKIEITSEKSETAELKDKVKELAEKELFSEACDYFDDYIAKRPDVSLMDSDLKAELPDIYVLLHIWNNETRYTDKTVRFAANISEWEDKICYYRRIETILNALGRGIAKEEDVSFLLANNPTPVAINTILDESNKIENAEVIKNILRI